MWAMMDELETGDIPILHFERWSQMQYRNDGGQDMFELDVECRVVKGQMFTAHPTWRTNPCDRAAPPAREGVIPAIVNHIDNDDFLRGVDTILGKRSRESPDNLAVEQSGTQQPLGTRAASCPYALPKGRGRGAVSRDSGGEGGSDTAWSVPPATPKGRGRGAGFDDGGDEWLPSTGFVAGVAATASADQAGETLALSSDK